MTIVALAEATPACGRKAFGLGVLLRAGMAVPDGFVVTDPAADEDSIGSRLDALRARAFAVRSSGRAEDSAAASFAGQLETVLGVRGIGDVRAAIQRCAASTRTPRARSYARRRNVGDDGDAAVIVQELVEADRAGVLFTRDPRSGDDTVVINASWGLGESVVSGAVVPDECVVEAADTIALTPGTKQTRLDLGDGGLIRSPVRDRDQRPGCLSSEEVLALAELGRRCEALFGEPQDVEWAACGGQLWVTQSRPITALPASPSSATRRGPGPVLLAGVPSSPGRANGPARLVHTVDDFGRFQRGDVLVCRTTDPAWTPLFGLAVGVVAEAGGVLCHAAIVAREYGIPAVVGARDAMVRLVDGEQIVIDGAAGIVARPEGNR